jgi:hypothetical protein
MVPAETKIRRPTAIVRKTVPSHALRLRSFLWVEGVPICDEALIDESATAGAALLQRPDLLI